MPSKTGTTHYPDPDSFGHTHNKILTAMVASTFDSTIYDFRHVSTTLALQNSVDSTLGYYSERFALDAYAYVTTAAQKEATNTIRSVLPDVATAGL